ncbi:MAG: MFS transporter [Chloroflexota bacterium]
MRPTRQIAPRGRLTWALFLTGASASYLLNGMGAILASIQDELGATRAEVGIYPTLFAAGLLLVGVAGDRLIAVLDRPMAVRVAVIASVVGAWLVVVPDRTTALAGAALMGAGGALLITLMPVIVGALHPHRTTAIFGELQGANSTASVIAPFLVGLALGIGIGWRPAYLLPTLLLLLVLPFLAGVPRRVAAARDPAGRAASAPRPSSMAALAPVPRARSLGRWADILISVSAEYCMVFWAASAFRDWHGASDDVAAALAAMFLLGMAAVRAVSSPLTRAIPDAWRLVTLGCVVAIVGFCAFWLGTNLLVCAMGAVVVGLGMGVHYPVLLPLFVSGHPESPDRAAARGTLASGLAIGGAPLVLAALSDRLGLHGPTSSCRCC